MSFKMIMYRKILLLLFLFPLFLFSCKRDEDVAADVDCPCDYPSWAQNYLQALNNDASDKPHVFFLFYSLSSGRPAYYAIVDGFDSNMHSGVSFYDRSGNLILEGDPLFDQLFASYARTGGFAVCDHQFKETYFNP